MGTSASSSSLPLPAPEERREQQSYARFSRRLVGLVSVLVASLYGSFSALVWYGLEGLSPNARRDLLGAGALGALLVLALGLSALSSFIAALREASEQRLTELRSSADAALARAEAKRLFLSQFLTDMSLDIRAPMNGVLGMTQLVLRSPLNSTQERQLRTIDGAARALQRMLGDILDFSKLEASRYELVPMGCSLHDILRVGVDLLDPKAKDKGLGLELRIENDVPDQVLLDAARLQQILINLAQNAIDGTDQGAVEIHVRAANLSHRSFELRVRIADTGAATPIRERQGPFEASLLAAGRASSGDPPRGGLGLVISRQLVALMGGTISLSAREGEGAVFELVVPVARIGDPAARSGEASSKAALLEIRLPSPTAPLLVVDADGLNQMIAVELLENLGFEVEVASSGQQAIEQVQRKRYALILMDCQMPERAGYLAAQRIRSLQGAENRTPIIGCGSLGGSDGRSRATAAGMDDYLGKPLERSALCNVLSRWLPDEANPASSGTRLSQTALLQRAITKGLARNASADGSMPAPGSAPPPDLLPRQRSERLLQLFVLEATEQLGALAQAVKRADAHEVVERARQLESSCLRCGAMKMAELCTLLGGAHDLSPDRLEAQVQALRAALSAVLARFGETRVLPENAASPSSTDRNPESP